MYQKLERDEALEERDRIRSRMEVKFENIDDEFNFVNSNLKKLAETDTKNLKKLTEIDTKNLKEFKVFEKKTNKNIKRIANKFMDIKNQLEVQ